MSLQDGAERRLWEPGPRVRAAFGRAVDLLFPPTTLDGAASPRSTGLSAEAWTRVQFIAEPLCDGCGQSTLMITRELMLRCLVFAFCGRSGVWATI
jgi:hypothetical protein